MSKEYFDETRVIRVVQQIQEASQQYDKLFTDLESQIYGDIVKLIDSTEVMAVCLAHVENAILIFKKHFPHNSEIQCRQGCCFCCYFPVASPPQGIEVIAVHLRATVKEDELDTLKEEMKRYIGEREGGLKRIKCPFLSVEKQCCIYAYRPLSCRSFTSADSRECDASAKDHRNISQDPVLHRIFQAATKALLRAAKQNGKDYHQQDFIPALLKMLSP